MIKIKQLHSYLKEHGKFRRWLVVLVWFLTCGFLIINYGILNSNSGKIKETAINKFQTIPGNDVQNIKLTDRSYDPKQNRMIVKLELSEAADIKSEILPQYLKYKIATVNPEKTKTSVIPITNTKYVMVIDNLKSDFKAIQIKVADKAPQQISSKPDDPYVQFIIKDKKSIEKNHISTLSPEKFAVASINDEIKDDQKAIQKNLKKNKNLKEMNQVNDQKIEEEKLNRKYQVASQQKETDEDIENLETDKETNNTEIQKNKDKNSKKREEINLLKDKQSAIKSGSYKLPKILKQEQILVKK